MRLSMVFILMVLSACGGGSASDNPPSIAGNYKCVTGCNGTCLFTDFVATQNKADFVITSSVSSCNGSVNNDGDFSADCQDINSNPGNCHGTFIGGQLTANCSIAGNDCQQVAYAKQ